MSPMARIGLGMLAIPIVACTGLGWSALRLPVAHTATVTVHVAAPPAEVEARVRDWRGAASWKPDVTEVVDLGVVDGRQRFRECTHECLDLEIVPGPEGPYVTRIVDHPDFGGTWTWRFTPDDGGTRVTVTEHGEVPNLVFRWFVHYVFGPEATLRATTSALRASFAHG